MKEGEREKKSMSLPSLRCPAGLDIYASRPQLGVAAKAYPSQRGSHAQGGVDGP